MAVAVVVEPEEETFGWVTAERAYMDTAFRGRKGSTSLSRSELTGWVLPIMDVVVYGAAGSQGQESFGDHPISFWARRDRRPQRSNGPQATGESDALSGAGQQLAEEVNDPRSPGCVRPGGGRCFSHPRFGQRFCRRLVSWPCDLSRARRSKGERHDRP